MNSSHFRWFPGAWLGLLAVTVALVMVCLPTALDAQTITIFAADLQDSFGNPMPSTAVAVLVADTGTNGFVAPQPTFLLSLGATWGTDDKVVALWDLSNCGCGDGILLDGKVITYTGGVTSNQTLQLYWFPSLTLASNTLGFASYGNYTDQVGLDGSGVWRTPKTGSSTNLVFLTDNEGGSNPQAAGQATNMTAVPLTAFQSWQLHYFASTNEPLAAASADPDGDGMSNTNEFLSGFNPTNNAASPRIISIIRTNDDINVIYLGANGDGTWSPGIASCTNILEIAVATASGSYSTNFASAGRTNVLSGGIGLGLMTNMVDTGGATNLPSRYYRVRVLAP